MKVAPKKTIWVDVEVQLFKSFGLVSIDRIGTSNEKLLIQGYFTVEKNISYNYPITHKMLVHVLEWLIMRM